MKDLDRIIKREGNFHEWTFQATNGLELKCQIKRNGSLALCGYVELTSDNKLFGLGYDHINSLIKETPHGGLTYSELIGGCWWVGFDCSHSGDLSPAFPEMNGIYRTKEFVISECQNLAESISLFSGIIQRLKKIDLIVGKS